MSCRADEHQRDIQKSVRPASWLIQANANCPDDDVALCISIAVRFPKGQLHRVIKALGSYLDIARCAMKT
jgi:hypothetical protein